MATDCISQVTFQGDGFAKPVVARFDRPDASTDGGLVLFKAPHRILAQKSASGSNTWGCGGLGPAVLMSVYVHE